jgi:hypothetical protein
LNIPYIKQERREDVLTYGAITPGELNFEITSVIKRYLDRQELSYTTINDILGALEGAKMEYYRRVAVPFEALKALENGDIYE